MNFDETDFLTVEEVCKILHLGFSTVYTMVHQPDFPKIKIGRVYRIPKEEFEKYLRRYYYKKYDLCR